jgi:hypothetical protein
MVYMSEIIYLPVSLGEAMDKLTILDIKQDRIKDSRRNDVLVEYDLLYKKLESYISLYKQLYESMKKVNTTIWDFMDDLRDGTLDEQSYFTLCKKTVEYNDIRFRIKNKINTVSGSVLKEQKGYKINSILVDISDSLIDIKNFVKPIRYYACLYDQIVIRYSGSSNFRSTFTDDPTIIFVDNIDTSFLFKETYTFTKNEYTHDELLDLFKIDDILINSIL